MYENENIKNRFKRDFALLVIALTIALVLYLLKLFGLINLS